MPKLFIFVKQLTHTFLMLYNADHSPNLKRRLILSHLVNNRRTGCWDKVFDNVPAMILFLEPFYLQYY